MSREFGNYNNGYMHDKLQGAADDCDECGRLDLTKRLGAILEALYPIAYAVSSAEACDWSEGDAISHAIAKLEAVEDAMRGLRCYLTPFKEVAEEAVRRAAAQGK